MSSLAPHPGRSADFLSRLLDGDLSAAERAQFESHRAHCAECRRAAADFESALALFRSSRTRPAASDLSARILRKLQAGNSRRRPFGVSFGIDLRWAGAFAAALLAVIIGSSVVIRRESAERKLRGEAGPIPVVMERDEAAGRNEKNLQPASPPVSAPASTATRHVKAAEPSRSAALDEKKDASGVSEFEAPAPPSVLEGAKDKARLQERVQAKPQEKIQANLQDKEAATRRDADNRIGAGRQTENRQDSQSGFLKQEAARRPAGAAATRNQEAAPGGEGNYAFDGIAENAAQGRLRIEPADNGGTPPALVNASEIEVPTELRGREFYVVVEAWGRVREVRPSDDRLRKKKVLRVEPQAQAQTQTGSVSEEERAQKAPDSLRNMRFAPSDRPRRLLVRVE